MSTVYFAIIATMKSTNSNRIGYLYVNGLININIKFIDKLIDWRWNSVGIDIQHSRTNWFDKTTIDDKVRAVIKQVDKMLQDYDGVAILGSSAGGSLAINAYAKLIDKNVCIVAAHSRLAVGNYSDDQKLSLYHSARIGKKISAPSFYESVKIAEDISILGFSITDKQRIMTMVQLTDGVVPLGTMSIDGAIQIRTLAFGHRMGFISHFIINRNRVIDFANRVLSKK